MAMREPLKKPFLKPFKKAGHILKGYNCAVLMMLPKIVLWNYFFTVSKAIFLLFMPFYAVVRSKDN
jgi:hypothetical protein